MLLRYLSYLSKWAHSFTRLFTIVRAVLWSKLDLLKLLGYYTAEGRDNGCLQFVFGTHEPELHGDVIARMRRVFGTLEPHIDHTTDHSTRITYYSATLGRFFARHSGTEKCRYR